MRERDIARRILVAYKERGKKILTACPGCEARAARNAAILSVVPAHTTQSSGKPAKQISI